MYTINQLIGWHEGMASEPKRNEAKKIKHSETAIALNNLASQVERLEAQRKELREALDFYARYILKRKSDGECITLTPIDHDCGDRARAALKATE